MSKSLCQSLEKFLYPDSSVELINEAEEKSTFQGETYRVLFLYDVNVGTKSYSPKALEGLVKELYGVSLDLVVISGILPTLPRYFGRRLKEFLRAVDSNIPKKYGMKVWKEILRKRKKEEELGIEKYDESPIPRDLYEFSIIAKYEIKKLLDKVKPRKIIYLWSQNDWENTLNLATMYLRKRQSEKLARLRRERKELTKKRKNSEKELKRLEKELERLEKEIPGDKSLESEYLSLKEKAESLKEEIERLAEEEQRIAEEIKHQSFRSMLKQWKVSAKDFQEAIDYAKNKYASELISPIFSSYNVKIYPYNAITLNLEGYGNLILSYNLNRVFSNTPLTSGIYRYQMLARNLRARLGSSPKMIIDGSIHKGGFRVLVDNVEGLEKVNPLYIVQLISFTKWSKDYALKKAYALQEQKKGIYDIDERGVVLMEIKKKGSVKFRVISTETLEYYNRYTSNNLEVSKVFITGDFHLGSRNEIEMPSNYEYVEMVGKELLKLQPDILVLTGDLVDGFHREEYKYIESSIVPAEAEEWIEILKKRLEVTKRAVRSKNLPRKTKEKLKKKLKEIEILLKRITLYSRKLSNLSVQREELIKGFLRPYASKFLRGKNKKMVIISGQHYNKKDFLSDEAMDIKQLFEVVEGLENKIIAVGGSEFGVGSETIDGIKFFFIHGPYISRWSYKDPVYRLLEHTNKESPDSKIAICGDLHIPSIGVANETAAVVSPALQQLTTYGKQKGYTSPVRGFIILKIKKRRRRIIDDFEFELFLDDYFKNTYPEHFFDVSKYLRKR